MRTNIKAKVFVVLYANCCTNCCNFNSCGIFEKVTSFLNPQPRLGTWKISGGRKFSEIKVQKNMSSNLGNTYCVLKCKKLGIENFIIVALLIIALVSMCSSQTPWVFDLLESKLIRNRKIASCCSTYTLNSWSGFCHMNSFHENCHKLYKCLFFFALHQITAESCR